YCTYMSKSIYLTSINKSFKKPPYYRNASDTDKKNCCFKIPTHIYIYRHGPTVPLQTGKTRPILYYFICECTKAPVTYIYYTKTKKKQNATKRRGIPMY